MPGTGKLAKNERWVIRIVVDGDRSQTLSNKVKRELDRLVDRLNKPDKKAAWKGKTRAK
jgi:hypothetical protein